MNRLFVRVKTDPRLKATLFEFSGQSRVGETLDLLISSMERMPQSEAQTVVPDYQMIRLGSPKRILERDQTFMQAGVGNNDTLVITSDAEAIMSQGLFEFEALSLEDQYLSVQDIRAPLHMPIVKTIALREKQQSQLGPPQQRPVETEPQHPVPAQDAQNPFGFQPLDLGISRPDQHAGKSDSDLGGQ